MVGLDLELFDQLAVDGFNDLAQRVKEATDRLGELSLLVASGQGVQTDAIVLPKFGSDLSTDIGFVADDVAVAVLRQEFAPYFQVKDTGRGEFEIEDETACSGQKMELVTENWLLEGGELAEICAMGCPVTTRIRGKMELNHGNGQTIDYTIPISREIDASQHHLSYPVDDKL